MRATRKCAARLKGHRRAERAVGISESFSAPGKEDFDEDVLRFVIDFELGLLDGNPLLLHEAQLMQESQVARTLHVIQGAQQFRRGNSAVLDALLDALARGQLSTVAQHAREPKDIEHLRIVLADIIDEEETDGVGQEYEVTTEELAPI